MFLVTFLIDPNVSYVQALTLFFHLTDDASRIEIFLKCTEAFSAMTKDEITSPVHASRLILLMSHFFGNTFADDSVPLSKHVSRQFFCQTSFCFNPD